jgi:hypothetical protein
MSSTDHERPKSWESKFLMWKIRLSIKIDSNRLEIYDQNTPPKIVNRFESKSAILTSINLPVTLKKKAKLDLKLNILSREPFCGARLSAITCK